MVPCERPAERSLIDIYDISSISLVLYIFIMFYDYDDDIFFITFLEWYYLSFFSSDRTFAILGQAGWWKNMLDHVKCLMDHNK